MNYILPCFYRQARLPAFYDGWPACGLYLMLEDTASLFLNC